MARVIPFPRTPLAVVVEWPPVTAPPPRLPAMAAPCVICGSNVDWDLHDDCARCKASMHEACYWGRVASLEEWRAFLRVVDSDPDDAGNWPWPEIVCPAWRAKAGA
jgi:hypothetical protein